MDAAGLDPARRLGDHVARLVIVAARASRDGLLNLRAMGLVYSTLPSLVARFSKKLRVCVRSALG